MPRGSSSIALLLGIVLLPGPAPACTLCGPNGKPTMPTLRQDAVQAKIILYGTMVDANLLQSTTLMKIERILRDDKALTNKKEVLVPKYLPPPNPKETLRYVLFVDVLAGRLDFYRGVPAKSPALVDYLKGAIEIDPKDSTAALRYFFRYLDHADDTIAADAYAEFAKANDKEVGQSAHYLDPAKLKKLLQDPKTPPERVALFSFLLGACGGEADAEFLRGLVEKPDPRAALAMDGILAGYIELRPKQGWESVYGILRDDKRPANERMRAHSTIRFYYAWKGKDIEREAQQGLGYLLEHSDLGDLAIEDLRQWKLWSLTPEVLAQYGKKSHEAPLMRRSIVRYAISCARGDSTAAKEKAQRFLAELSKKDAELVKEVEESISFEEKKK